MYVLSLPRYLQELSEWACIYIRYLQIFRKLEMAYDQMLQPQKRQDMKKALEACMGRMLEIRHWMVSLQTTTHVPAASQDSQLSFIQLDSKQSHRCTQEAQQLQAVCC